MQMDKGGTLSKVGADAKRNVVNSELPDAYNRADFRGHKLVQCLEIPSLFQVVPSVL